MIIINLLPHRALRQQRFRRQTERTLTLLFAAACLLLSGAAAYGGLTRDGQQQRQQLLQQAHQDLDQKITQLNLLRQEITRLRMRHSQLANLQQQRNASVRLLTELAQSVHSGVTLRLIEQQLQHISLQGHAASLQDLSLLLARLRQTSTFARAQLRHTEHASASDPSLPDAVRHSFTITVAPSVESKLP